MPEGSQQARFGRLRAAPPPEVLEVMGCRTDTRWSAEKLGDFSDFPNGGMWRVACSEGDAQHSAVVKRTGPQYLGADRIWRGSADPNHPQWWGREAQFYKSDLATRGWADQCRAARCLAIDDHDGCRDLWLEDILSMPLPLSAYEGAITGIARWQAFHRSWAGSWVSQDWIPAHLARRQLSNARTLAHPDWPQLLRRGISEAVREGVKSRITDPARATVALDGLPQLLTHYDLHQLNLGLIGSGIVIIDWATVGWGPAGHDVGHAVIDLMANRGGDVAEMWGRLSDVYVAALTAAGLDLEPAEVHRSIAVSNVLRQSWIIDHLLDQAETLPDQVFRGASAVLEHLATLQARYLGDPSTARDSAVSGSGPRG